MAMPTAMGLLMPVLPLPSSAAPLEGTFNGLIDTIDLSKFFAPGTVLGGCSGATHFRQPQEISWDFPILSWERAWGQMLSGRQEVLPSSTPAPFLSMGLCGIRS
ncbi:MULTISPECIES: hypothetical protein [unclassified Cyanobium]|uniref:hypothetical protein n=1 Tax=unclassified Cyanobium TaxID=2627006 RepID=UPI0020CE22D3|nr:MULTISPECIES: hypothetical protein [unclassified Cyanobium]MCP9834949.1 hypothetical protein [Cyanobium sp. La Preciosa 7G6]MCP9937712.1 hypothetical protein [Cyanobium sp. Aljojuca 7A6]